MWCSPTSVSFKKKKKDPNVGIFDFGSPILNWLNCHRLVHKPVSNDPSYYNTPICSIIFMVVCVKRTNQIPNPMAYAIDMILCVNLSKYAGNETRGLKTNIPTFGKFQNLSVRRDLRVVLSKFAGNESRGLKTNIPTFGTFQNLSVRRDLCNHCLHTASLTRTISNVILGDPTFKETGSNKKTWHLPNVGIFDFHHPYEHGRSDGLSLYVQHIQWFCKTLCLSTSNCKTWKVQGVDIFIFGHHLSMFNICTKVCHGSVNLEWNVHADEGGKGYPGRFGLHSDQQGCQLEAVAALTAQVGPKHLFSVRCSVGRFLAEAPKRVFSRRISVWKPVFGQNWCFLVVFFC